MLVLDSLVQLRFWGLLILEANPNLIYYSTPSLGALLTLFNHFHNKGNMDKSCEH